MTFDGKRIISEIHTHPSSYYKRKTGSTDGYDGPSMKDYNLAKIMNCPVYSIGPNSVSRILPSSNFSPSIESTLSSGKYPNPLVPDKTTNPFLIANRWTFLANPNLYFVRIWW